MRWLLAVVAIGCAHTFVPEEAAHVERHAPAASAKAPSATLVTPSGSTVTLADLTRTHGKTIVVWYRGFF